MFFSRTQSTSQPQYRAPRRVRRPWTTGLLLVTAAVAIGALSVAGVAPATEAATSTRCDGSAGSDQNNLRVTPSHGSVFYIDSGQGQNIDAAYAAYQVSTQGTARSGLWVSLDSFTGGAVSLANPADSAQPIGDLGANAQSTAFFLLRAVTSSTRAQAHVVHVYSGRPGATGATELYSCTFSFAKVAETIKASANKVTGISSTSVSTLGSTMTITVLGNSGTLGSGNAIDGRMIWLSPAARSSWPTQALRLEDTSVRVYTNNGRSQEVTGSPFVKQLRIPLPADKYYYTAVYTFRVIGRTPTSSVPVLPIAQISSGTQIKHTDIGSIAATTVDTSTTATKLTVTKTVATPATVSSGKFVFNYTISMSNAGSALSVDSVTDAADSRLAFVPGSARFNSTAITDAGALPATPSQRVFAGPFSIPAGTDASPTVRTLTYQMTVACSVGTFTYNNSATAQIGAISVGSSPTSASGVALTATDCDPTIVAPPVVVPLSVEPTTVAATSVSMTGATLNGQVDPNGMSGKSVKFEWGTTANLTSPTTVTLANTTSVTDPYSVSTALTGLTSGTQYWFRIVADGVAGSTLTFTTPEPVGTPAVQTTAATDVTATTATLVGIVDPNQVPNGAKVKFQYGRAVAGSCTSPSNLVLDSGFVQSPTDTGSEDAILQGAFPAEISGDAKTGLVAGIRYCYQVIAYYNTTAATWDTAVAGAWVPFYTSTKTAQTISLTTPADQNTVATVTPTISSTSGLAVTLSSDTPDVCTVDASNVVTTLTPGTCSITANQAGNDSYSAAPAVTVTFQVSKRSQTISFTAPATLTLPADPGSANPTTPAGATTTATTAGGSALAITYTSSTPSVCTVDAAGTITALSAGTCSVTASQPGDARYLPAADVTRSFEVKSGPRVTTSTLADGTIDSAYSVTLAASGGNGTYSNWTLTAGTLPDGLTLSAAGVLSGTPTSAADATSLTVTVDSNGVTSPPRTLTLTIAKRDQVIAAADITRVYGDSDLPVSLTSTAGKPVALSLSGATDVASLPDSTTVRAGNVGTTTVTLSAPGDARYRAASRQITMRVTPAPLQVAAPSPVVTYGDAAPALAPRITGFVRGESASALRTAPGCATSYTPATAVGARPAVTCSGGAADNYSLSYTSGAVTVQPATLTVSASDSTVEYGSAAPTIAPRFRGFVNSENASALSRAPGCTSDYTATTAAGTTVASRCGSATAANYGIVYETGTVTIDRAPATVTARAAEVTYGDDAPALTATVSGLRNGETPSAVLSQSPRCSSAYAPGTAVGAVGISCTDAAAANYRFTYAPGRLTVVPAPLAVTAPSRHVTYGDPTPALSASVRGWVAADESRTLDVRPTCTTTYSPGTAVRATPTVSCSGGRAANYDLSYTPGTITIDPALLTVTPAPTTVRYGAPTAPVRAELDGFVADEGARVLATAPTCRSDYTAGLAAGDTATATCAGGEAANYDFAYVSGAVTVDPAPLVVQAPSVEVTYGTADPSLEASFDGFVLGEDAGALNAAPTCDSSYEAGRDAGSVVPVVCGGASADNYDISTEPGSITVMPSPLDVLAPAETVTYGDDAPALTPAFDGFVLEQDADVLDTVPTCSTRYRPGDGVGSTPAVTCEGGADGNYNLDYTPAAITIDPAPLRVTPPTITATYGDATATVSSRLAPRVDGFVLGEDATVLRTPAQCSSDYTRGTTAGTVLPVTCRSVSAANYLPSYRLGSVTVGRANDAILVEPAQPADMRPGATQTVVVGSASGRNVVVTTSGPCAWANDVLTALDAAGDCAITAALPENPNYVSSAPATLGVAVRADAPVVRSLALAASASSALVGTPVTLAATPSAGAGAITFHIASANALCRLDGASLSATGVANCSVAANIAADGRWQAAASRVVTVTFYAPSSPPQPPTTPPTTPPTAPPIDPRAATPPVVVDPPAPPSRTPVISVPVTPPVPGADDSASSSDFGLRTIPEISRERFRGFAPNISTTVDVVGSRTVGQFVVSPGSVGDPVGLAAALTESTRRNAADFARITSVGVVPSPAEVEGAVVSGPVPAGVADLFAQSGLSAPRTVGSVLEGRGGTWLKVSAEAASYRPGTVVSLAVTTRPLILATAVVSADGTASLSGLLPLSVLDAGGHNLRIIGDRLFTDVTADADGHVQLTDTALAEIQRFDSGTKATVTVVGPRSDGALHRSVREVILRTDAPWWAVALVVGLGALAVLRRRGAPAPTRRQRAFRSAGLTVAVAIPLIAGWVTACYPVMGWGAVASIAGIVAVWLAHRRPQRTVRREHAPA